jgi:hypothetical protein
VRKNLGGCVEFDATTCTLFVSLQDHVRHDLELSNSLELQLRLELLVAKGSHGEIVVLSVCAAEVNLLVLVATPLDSRAHAIDDDAILRSRLLLRNDVLTW